jgi:hypothetical protein
VFSSFLSFFVQMLADEDLVKALKSEEGLNASTTLSMASNIF